MPGYRNLRAPPPTPRHVFRISVIQQVSEPEPRPLLDMLGVSKNTCLLLKGGGYGASMSQHHFPPREPVRVRSTLTSNLGPVMGHTCPIKPEDWAQYPPAISRRCSLLE